MTSLNNNWIFAVYKGEYLYIYGADKSVNELYVVADSTSDYSDEFINVVLSGKKGRDVFAWCSPDIFTEFYICNDYFNHKAENKAYIPREKVMDYVILINGGEMKKK